MYDVIDMAEVAEIGESYMLQTRFEVGWKSALRAIIPVGITLAGAFFSGQIHDWRSLVVAAVAAVLGKGAVSGASAKSVQVVEPVESTP